MIIKHKLNLSDEKTVLQIQENPYLQYFVGLSSYKDEPPFTASLLVEIRKRLGRKVFSSFEKTILRSIENKRSRNASKQLESSDTPENRGKMVLDAIVAEQAIRYPTDISLLNETREISEQLIDELYAISSLTKKPRTYRQQARKRYLAISKKRRCDDRIVSISQPHVRPIVRGKASHTVEFGLKLSVYQHG